MAAKVVLVTSTKKGAFVFTSSTERKNWEMTGPHAGGLDINHAIMDPRTETLYATANNPWFGPQVTRSTDFGRTWQDAQQSPRFSGEPNIKGMDEEPWFLRQGIVTERFWRLTPGRPGDAGAIWCGVAPGALFQSSDGGETFAENTALSGHPARKDWQPSNGGLALHSIVLDRNDPGRMWVAVSAGGVYRSDDGGLSWKPTNRGLRSEMSMFDPNVELYPEWGQCVHQLVHAPGKNDRLYLQTHLGTYRTDDAGETWTDITAGLPSEFGLCMAVHGTDPDTAYVVPLTGGELRCPPEFKLRVFRTRDAGKTWQPMTGGLPQENAYMGVYRAALTTDPLEPGGVYFGTNTGQLYVSRDDGASFDLVTQNLPPITAVEVTVLE